MSPAKNDQVFPHGPPREYERDLTIRLAEALRSDFGGASSTIKIIGKLTNANPRAIRNWYEAKSLPTAGRLLILARSSPSVRKLVYEEIDASVTEVNFALGHDRPSGYGTINGTLTARQIRQLRIIEQVKCGEAVKASQVANTWSVSVRTARRDLGALKKAGKIRFVGGKRNGKYQMGLPST